MSANHRYADAPARFHARVSRGAPNECWIWNGAPAGKGYGSFRFNLRPTRAHRVAWMLSEGRPVPDGMDVLHRCDVRNCCNPAHLFLGTNADNVSDKVSKNRQARGDAVQTNDRLNDVAVRVIRYLCSHGRTRAEVARAYGLSWTTIADTVSGKRWGHVA